MSDELITRQEVEALLAARVELGPAYDDAMVDSFAERIERAVAERTDSELARSDRSRRREDDTDSRQLALGIVSLGTGIPISAIASTQADLPGLVTAWVGIVGVNLAYALRGRRRR